MLESELLAKQICHWFWSKTQVKRYPLRTVYGTVISIGRYVYLKRF